MRTMDYRRIRVEALVVRSNHMLMVRQATGDGSSVWALPATELEEGETPEDGVERALFAQTGWEGIVRRFVHRRKLKEGPYRMILTFLVELKPVDGDAVHDLEEVYVAEPGFEVKWRSLRNYELRDAYREVLKKAHL